MTGDLDRFTENLDVLAAAALAPHPKDVPGAMAELVTREVPGGIVEFSYAPAGWLSQDGEVRVEPYRAYHWVPDPRLCRHCGGTKRLFDRSSRGRKCPTCDGTGNESKRVRVPSMTTWLGQVLPKDLTRFGEMHGIIGAVEAVRRGELDPHVHTDEDAVERVRALKLGADAARDRRASEGIDSHAVLEEWARTGSFPTLDVPLELQGYVAGIAAFIREFDPEPDAVEQLVADPVRGFAGRMDLRGTCRSPSSPARRMRVLDLKTSPKLWVWPQAHYQTRGYTVADRWCGGPECDTPLIVVVDAEGRFEVVECLVGEEQLDRALSFYRDLKPVDSACSSRHRTLRKEAA